MTRWDVIVLGLGGVGSAAAYHLARGGHRVLGVEQFGIAHDRGSSHGQTRVIRQAYFEHPCYVPLLRRAYDHWDELQDNVDETLFVRCGLVEMGPADGVLMQGIGRSVREYDLDVETLTMSEVTARWPDLLGDSSWQAVVEKNAGLLRVESCVRAHLELANQAGASCLFGQSVVQWEADPGGVSIHTPSGIHRGDHLVIAAGAWSGKILQELGIPLRVLSKKMYWLPAKSASLSVDAGFPCFFFDSPQGYYYGFPTDDRGDLKIARHSGGQQVDDPSDGHPDDHEDWSLVQDFCGRHLSGLELSASRQCSCFYTVTPDEHFIVDTHPMHDRVTVVAGLSGHGFKFTSVLGEVAAKMAARQSPEFDLEPFQFGRFEPSSE